MKHLVDSCNKWKAEEKIDYSKKKVLVVDDNSLNIKVAIRLLDNYKGK